MRPNAQTAERLLRMTYIGSPKARRVLLTAGVLLPLLVVGGCWLDGSLWLKGPGKGLLQHYGYWALFITTPTIVLLTATLFDVYRETIQRTELYCVGLGDDMSARLNRLIERHVRSLSLRSLSASILVFIMIVLACWWVVNVITTVSPVSTYRHDVFDSYAHPFGFATAKLYLFFVFVFVDATAIFIALHITASMISILRFVCYHKVLSVNMFHSDNCGGTSRFGNVNLLILTIYFNFFVVISAMYLTHRGTYLVMAASLTASSCLAVLQSVAAVYYIHKAVSQKKEACIDIVIARLNDQFSSSLGGNAFPQDLLAFRNHLMGIHTFPYASSALIAVNIIRFAPAAIASVTFARGSHVTS